MAGSSVLHNTFENIGYTPQQQNKQPLSMGPHNPNMPYQQPSIGTSNVLPIATPQGDKSYQTVWSQPGRTYAPGGPQNLSNVPLA